MLSSTMMPPPAIVASWILWLPLCSLSPPPSASHLPSWFSSCISVPKPLLIQRLHAPAADLLLWRNDSTYYAMSSSNSNTSGTSRGRWGTLPPALNITNNSSLTSTMRTCNIWACNNSTASSRRYSHAVYSDFSSSIPTLDLVPQIQGPFITMKTTNNAVSVTETEILLLPTRVKSTSEVRLLMRPNSGGFMCVVLWSILCQQVVVLKIL